MQTTIVIISETIIVNVQSPANPVMNIVTEPILSIPPGHKLHDLIPLGLVLVAVGVAAIESQGMIMRMGEYMRDTA